MGKKKYFKKAELSRSTLLSLFRNTKKPLTPREILHAMRLEKKDRPRIFSLLEELIKEGKIIRTKDKYGLVNKMSLITGKLEVQRSGVGFVIPDDKRRGDIFISPADFNNAWHGDKVVASITSKARDGRKGKSSRNAEGRIVRIIERSMKKMSARVEKELGRNYLLCQPTDPRQTASFMIEGEDDGPKIGQIIVIEPGELIDRELWTGTVVENLGYELDIAVQEGMVKVNHNIPQAFPAGVLAEANMLPSEPSEQDFEGRKDLRHLPFVTIDGEKARDFDDAILVEPGQNGGYRLHVAIADVSHYVPHASTMDNEARKRGNSYYFPSSVEPMFPEALSNGLCSLNPHVPRLAMVAEMDFDDQGICRKSRFHAAVIKSHARLTYTQVSKAIIEKDEAVRSEMGEILPLVERAEELARKINARRTERGSLDFDLPEPEIHYNMQGETTDIRPAVRTFAHQLIEEFMVAANEAVASFLEERELGQLFRVHPVPDADKVRNLYKMLSKTELATELPDEVTPTALQNLLRKAEQSGTSFVVSRLLLRTMMQAKYSPHNEGHFGLASESYAHFTSPIRRYADLIVHRALKDALNIPGGRPYSVKSLEELGDQLSATERSAMEAEREIFKRLTVIFLMDKVGNEYTGVINSLADFGFWVELEEVMAEGLVRLSSLGDDYYTLIPEHQMLLGQRTGKQFKLGQKIRVRLAEVNLTLLQIDLEWLGELGKDVDESFFQRPEWDKD